MHYFNTKTKQNKKTDLLIVQNVSEFPIWQDSE